MNRGRILTYRFFELPNAIKFEIAWNLNLIENTDVDFTDTELFRRVLKKARDTDCMAKLWDAVQEKHGDGCYAKNPYCNKVALIKYMVLYTYIGGGTFHQTFNNPDESSRCYSSQEQKGRIPVWGHCNPNTPGAVGTLHDTLKKLQRVKIEVLNMSKERLTELIVSVWHRWPDGKCPQCDNQVSDMDHKTDCDLGKIVGRDINYMKGKAWVH